MTRISDIKIYLFVLIGVICVHPRLTSGQAPEILKVDPPSWWVGSSMNPVRVMIRGGDFAGARGEGARVRRGVGGGGGGGGGWVGGGGVVRGVRPGGGAGGGAGGWGWGARSPPRI